MGATFLRKGKGFYLDAAALIYLPRIFNQDYGFIGFAQKMNFKATFSKGSLLVLGLDMIDASVTKDSSLTKDTRLTRSRAFIRTMAKLLREFINDQASWDNVVMGKPDATSNSAAEILENMQVGNKQVGTAADLLY